ncbi:MAG: lipocalin-like domain-containing protein [Bacteroidaceae bacterium]|nr:lipocalin-like domain-containing protein [Bacteroidaceae bacterium]
METTVRKGFRYLIMAVSAMILLSCENVFHNDRLDFMWRLDTVEYLDGKDFDGNSVNEENRSGCWFSFARDLVEIDNRNSYFEAIGILTDDGDYLTLDFSMCGNVENLDSELRKLGLGSRKERFQVNTLDGSRLVLTGNKTRLSLTKW